MRNCKLALLLSLVLVVACEKSAVGQKTGHTSLAEFHAFLTKLDAAQLELHNGKPDAFKSIWSRADDITLSGGFGGTVEKGWARIGERLDWVGKQFSHGTNSIERLVANQNGTLGYVIQLEHIRFRVARQENESTKNYRVTMIFRREKGGWKIVHRQADSQMTKEAPQ